MKVSYNDSLSDNIWTAASETLLNKLQVFQCNIMYYLRKMEFKYVKLGLH